MGWAYGLYQNEKGNLELGEVYNVRGSTGFANVGWKNITKSNYEMILKDIESQIKGIIEDKQKQFKFKVNKKDIKKSNKERKLK